MKSSSKTILAVGTTLSVNHHEMISKRGLNLISLHQFNGKGKGRPNQGVNIEIDLNDTEKVLDTVKELSIKHNIVHVYSINEYRVSLASKIAEFLNLECNIMSEDAALNCRIKKKTRRILNETNISSLNYKLVKSKKEIGSDLSEFSFPVIVKPCNGSGSDLVRKCQNISEVKNAISFIRLTQRNWGGQNFDEDILIEEYVDGKEYSIESVTVAGETKTIMITEKITTSNHLLVEVGHNVPANLNDEDIVTIKRLAKETINALGIEYGSTHIEVKLSKNGPKIIEVNPRPGHERIHVMVELVTGYNMRDLALHINLGGSLSDLPKISPKALSASVRFFLASQEGTFSVEEPETKPGEGYMEEFLLYKKHGEKVVETTNNFERLGYVVVSGDIQENAITRAERFLEEFNYIVE